MAISLFERAGGNAALTALADDFYRRVLADPLLRPLFADPSADHAGRMAAWLIELTGGAKLHTETRGGFAAMARAHRGLQITEGQRSRWVTHMTDACTAAGLPDDFMAVFGPYLASGSHAAKAQSRTAAGLR